MAGFQEWPIAVPTVQPAARLSTPVVIAIAVTVLAWASAFIVIRGVAPDFGGGALALARLTVGSLLLGLYDDEGILHHVGHTSSFKAAEKRELAKSLAAYVTDDEGAGFGHGRTPGAPSRWTQGKDVGWVRVRPDLVCEVTFDYLQGNRFRHAATFARWRPDKPAGSCTFDQIATTVPFELGEIFAP